MNEYLRYRNRKKYNERKSRYQPDPGSRLECSSRFDDGYPPAELPHHQMRENVIFERNEDSSTNYSLIRPSDLAFDHEGDFSYREEPRVDNFEDWQDNRDQFSKLSLRQRGIPGELIRNVQGDFFVRSGGHGSSGSYDTISMGEASPRNWPDHHQHESRYFDESDEVGPDDYDASSERYLNRDPYDATLRSSSRDNLPLIPSPDEDLERWNPRYQRSDDFEAGPRERFDTLDDEVGFERTTNYLERISAEPDFHHQFSESHFDSRVIRSRSGSPMQFGDSHYSLDDVEDIVVNVATDGQIVHQDRYDDHVHFENERHSEEYFNRSPEIISPLRGSGESHERVRRKRSQFRSRQHTGGGHPNNGKQHELNKRPSKNRLEKTSLIANRRVILRPDDDEIHDIEDDEDSSNLPPNAKLPAKDRLFPPLVSTKVATKKVEEKDLPGSSRHDKGGNGDSSKKGGKVGNSTTRPDPREDPAETSVRSASPAQRQPEMVELPHPHSDDNDINADRLSRSVVQSKSPPELKGSRKQKEVSRSSHGNNLSETITESVSDHVIDVSTDDEDNANKSSGSPDHDQRNESPEAYNNGPKFDKRHSKQSKSDGIKVVDNSLSRSYKEEIIEIDSSSRNSPPQSDERRQRSQSGHLIQARNSKSSTENMKVRDPEVESQSKKNQRVDQSKNSSDRSHSRKRQDKDLNNGNEEGMHAVPAFPTHCDDERSFSDTPKDNAEVFNNSVRDPRKKEKFYDSSSKARSREQSEEYRGADSHEGRLAHRFEQLKENWKKPFEDLRSSSHNARSSIKKEMTEASSSRQDARNRNDKGENQSKSRRYIKSWISKATENGDKSEDVDDRRNKNFSNRVSNHDDRSDRFQSRSRRGAESSDARQRDDKRTLETDSQREAQNDKRKQIRESKKSRTSEFEDAYREKKRKRSDESYNDHSKRHSVRYDDDRKARETALDPTRAGTSRNRKSPHDLYKDHFRPSSRSEKSSRSQVIGQLSPLWHKGSYRVQSPERCPSPLPPLSSEEKAKLSLENFILNYLRKNDWPLRLCDGMMDIWAQAGFNESTLTQLIFTQQISSSSELRQTLIGLLSKSRLESAALDDFSPGLSGVINVTVQYFEGKFPNKICIPKDNAAKVASTSSSHMPHNRIHGSSSVHIPVANVAPYAVPPSVHPTLPPPSFVPSTTPVHSQPPGHPILHAVTHGQAYYNQVPTAPVPPFRPGHLATARVIPGSLPGAPVKQGLPLLPKPVNIKGQAPMGSASGPATSGMPASSLPGPISSFGENRFNTNAMGHVPDISRFHPTSAQLAHIPTTASSSLFPSYSGPPNSLSHLYQSGSMPVTSGLIQGDHDRKADATDSWKTREAEGRIYALLPLRKYLKDAFSVLTSVGHDMKHIEALAEKGTELIAWSGYDLHSLQSLFLSLGRTNGTARLKMDLLRVKNFLPEGLKLEALAERTMEYLTSTLHGLK